MPRQKSKAPLKTKPCAYCGDPVPKERGRSAHCSPAHYMRAYRREQAGLHPPAFRGDGRRGRLRLGEQTKLEKLVERLLAKHRDHQLERALVALENSNPRKREHAA